MINSFGSTCEGSLRYLEKVSIRKVLGAIARATAAISSITPLKAFIAIVTVKTPSSILSSLGQRVFIGEVSKSVDIVVKKYFFSKDTFFVPFTFLNR